MPANLSPEYKAAEAEFRGARSPEDRLQSLREMLRTLPKHKGTEHLQADIRTRIKEITEELAGPKKGGARTAWLIHKELADSLRFARLWRRDFEGRQIGREHPVEDGDVIELHVQ